MTPYRDGGSGTLMIDRRFKGVGRIKRASGLNDVKTWRRMIERFVDLADDTRGRELLRAIKRGELTPIEFFNGTGTSPQDEQTWRAGYERGRQEGLVAGGEDRNRGVYDLSGQRELEEARSGYHERLGRLEVYQAGYRAGFRSGYDDGYK